MSKLRRHTASLLAACALLLVPAAGGEEVNIREYDWLIEAQTQEIKHYLDYPDSKLRPIFKVSVSYKKTDLASTFQTVQYEDLYFSGCNSIGCRRYHTFSVTNGDGIGIRIKSKSANPDAKESCAAAGTIVRLLLDAYLNGNSVGSILIPVGMFNQVVRDLQRQNFYAADDPPPDTPVDSSIILHLRSEPPGITQVMNYSGRTPD